MISKTLSQVANEAIQVYQEASEAANYDAGFDAGEFSGSYSEDMADKQVEKLSVNSGYTFSQVMNELQNIIYTDMLNIGE